MNDKLKCYFKQELRSWAKDEKEVGCLGQEPEKTGARSVLKELRDSRYLGHSAEDVNG